MGKPDWKYNPMRDGGVSIAAQEDSARETQAQRDRDEMYANDVNTLAAVFRTRFGSFLQDKEPRSMRAVLTFVGQQLDSRSAYDLFLVDVFHSHGPGAVLLALKRAYDQPEHVTSDVVEHP